MLRKGLTSVQPYRGLENKDNPRVPKQLSQASALQATEFIRR